MRLVMAKPAASSFALLILWPVDKRSIDIDIFLFTLLIEPCAASALILVLITDMGFSFKVLLHQEEMMVISHMAKESDR
jgi:hypothetical protein